MLWYVPEVNLLNKIWKMGQCATHTHKCQHTRTTEINARTTSINFKSQRLKPQCELHARISLQRSTHFYKHEASKGDWDQRANNKDQSQTSFRLLAATKHWTPVKVPNRPPGPPERTDASNFVWRSIPFAMKLYQIIIAFTPQHISNNYQQI